MRLGNDRSQREYEFDFAIAEEADLRGVEEELARFIADGVVNSSSINAFFERTLAFPTARNYAGGITEYLYWLAGRGQVLDATAEVRNREKLNKAADMLRDLHRPASLAVTSLISFHFNQFGEAAHRALSPHLGMVAERLGRMLTVRTTPADLIEIPGTPSHLEQLLADDRTRDLIKLCSLPLSSASSAEVSNFDLATVDGYDLTKAALFITEHHLATGDPRAAPLVRAGSKNGLPDHWVNARLDCITDEGPPWNTAPATTTPVSGGMRITHSRKTTKAAPASGKASTTDDSTPNRRMPNVKGQANAPSEPSRSTERRTPAGTTSANTPTSTPTPRRNSETSNSRTGAVPTTGQPVPAETARTGANGRTTGTNRSPRPRPAPPVFLEPTVPPTENLEPTLSGRAGADARTTRIADTPPWETSANALTSSTPSKAPKPTESRPSTGPLLDRLLPWRKSKSR
ncbi:hypothetical protein HNC20_18305 [Rhodococcus rhodochrous]|uniref:hypothetical protein n=1 Tax=Rhodococcus rhodochrous TaxID=1829 RepID=UPI0012D3BBBA|nr:hypothetical protein [Rhodococcus rhodochrous]MDO1485893.1 hypothetical protein [Rhodococcus rhodochrous]